MSSECPGRPHPRQIEADLETVEFSSTKRRNSSSGRPPVGSAPSIRRVVSEPGPCAPPRRPSRSSSLERQDTEKFGVAASTLDDTDNGDEYDRERFLQLLLGENGIQENNYNSILPMLELQPQVSSYSEPPIITRSFRGADKKKESGFGSTRTGESLPTTCFRPRPIRRRRRAIRRTSTLTPPRLPSRALSESESDDSDSTNTPSANEAADFPGMVPQLVYCKEVDAALPLDCSPCPEKCLSEAPKRPRRSLSPAPNVQDLVDELFDHKKAIDSTKDILASFPNDGTSVAAGPTIAVSDDASAKETKTTGSCRKRNLPVRAKTFSFYNVPHKEKMATFNTDCISLLAVKLQVGRDLKGNPIEKTNQAAARPAPRRGKVLPGRSKTFSFYQTSGVCARA
jgi:hypothetical protein